MAAARTIIYWYRYRYVFKSWLCLTLSFFFLAWRTFKVENMLSLGLINGTVWRDCRNTKLRVLMLFVASQRYGSVWRYSQREYRHNVSHLNVVDNFLFVLSVCKALEPSLANLFSGTQLKKICSTQLSSTLISYHLRRFADTGTIFFVWILIRIFILKDPD